VQVHLAARSVRAIGTGAARSLVAVAVGAVAPLVWAPFLLIAYWWRGNPWSWISLVLAATVATGALARPVATLTRFLVRRWTGVELPGRRRAGVEPTRLASGYWWNGYSYERTRKDAEQDLRWRMWLHDPTAWRDLRWIFVAPLVAGLPAAIAPAAVVAAVAALRWGGVPAGIALIALALLAAPLGWRALPAAAGQLLRPSVIAQRAERTDQLLAERADQTAAQAAELRRIERDLHDGTQARLVAAGLSIATAERLLDTDPDKARELLRDARAGMAGSLAELRDIVRGIAPPVLTERGPAEALRALAVDLPVPAGVESTLDGRLDVAVESALYFAVAELLANAVKHGAPSSVRVRLDRERDAIVAEVDDDGGGGATVREGGGLAGVARRLAAFDGTLTLTSPPGGPTRARIVLPCAS
jgi:signal transduction histidine kinase